MVTGERHDVPSLVPGVRIEILLPPSFFFLSQKKRLKFRGWAESNENASADRMQRLYK